MTTSVAPVPGSTSEYAFGSRVRIVNAPGRLSMQEQELPHLLNAEGTVMRAVTVLDEPRYVVRFESDKEYWFHADELRQVTVQNLTANVEVYKQPADYLEADAFQSHAYEEAAARLDVELAEPLEVITVGCLVEVSLPYLRPFRAFVESINEDAGKLLLCHFTSMATGWYTLDNVRLVWTAAVAREALGLGDAVEAETPETAETVASVS